MRGRSSLRDGRRNRWPRVGALLAAAAAVSVFAPASACAATPATHTVAVIAPLGLLGIDLPSISGILRSIANDLFGVLASAFLPAWLRHASLGTLRWLIALPDPADARQWPTMHHLEQDTTAVAVAFLPLTLAISAARYTASSLSGSATHPAQSLGRLVGAAVGLLVFPWAFGNVVAAVNVTTSALLGFADVGDGLARAVGLLFAGGVAFGVTGALIGLLVIAAILLAVALLIIKVGIFATFALLYAAGPLTLAGYPIPELHGAFRMWLLMLAVVALVPVGWCLIFAVAGALSADITHLSTPAAIGSRTVGFFAAVLMFFIAFRWPFFLIGAVRNHGLFAGGLGAGAAASSSAAGGSGRAPVAARVAQGRLALLAGGGALGSSVAAAGGALGAPRGGLAGGGARLARRGAAWGAAKAGRTSVGASGRQALSSGAGRLRARTATSGLATSRLAGRALAVGAVIAAAPAKVRDGVKASTRGAVGTDGDLGGAARSLRRARRHHAQDVGRGSANSDPGASGRVPRAGAPGKPAASRPVDVSAPSAPRRKPRPGASARDSLNTINSRPAGRAQQAAGGQPHQPPATGPAPAARGPHRASPRTGPPEAPAPSAPGSSTPPKPAPPNAASAGADGEARRPGRPRAGGNEGRS